MKTTNPTAKPQVAAEEPTGTQGAVLAVLAKLHVATAADVAEAAGIGRSTANKALAALESDRLVERELGGRNGTRRLPDRWSLPRKAMTGPAPAESIDGQAAPTARLSRGDLGTMVLAHLRANPGAEHSPTSVANAIGAKSSGATANALVRLVERGEAVQTTEKPKRYQVVAPS
ncbi:MAG TPA: MarR family transcriptional regulator [Acidimicrobiales bacterium]|nr:MarR family transcriptional regulator [Acidimicrobiales bacterium]